jgi:CBS domain containing-hemolysin-like protein
MTTFILAIIFLLLALFGIALRKTYDYLPRKELKRQARAGDQIASVLYRAVAYGPSLRALLWLFIGICAAAGFVLFTQVAPDILAFLAVAGLLWYGFVWMPAARVSKLGARLVVAVTPFVAWLLNYLHPVLSQVAAFVRSRRSSMFHTGLYEREDLVEFLELQRGLDDSRIAPAEIDMAVHALTFGERTVGEVMTPRRAVKMVKADDTIGPVVLDELHDSGHSRFPVYNDNNGYASDGTSDVIVGTLYIHDLIDIKHGGKVRDAARLKVYYVHEDQSLFQVLHAFIKTKHHLFVVVNSFEEFVGIITIEDVLEQVIGQKISDEFDRYDDVRAVAKKQASQQHDLHKAVPETVAEVVE